MACAARCACSPRTVNLPPRRAMVTSSADSIWRRFSSSAPHRRARRWLSTGSILTSTALLAIRELAAQRVGNDRVDANVREAVDERLLAGKVHDAVVGGPRRQLAVAPFGKTFDENALRGAHHGLACLAVLSIQEHLQ